MVVIAKHEICSLIIITFLFSCSEKKNISLKPIGFIQKDTISINNGELKVTFIDNKKFGEFHRSGYNGIAELHHANEDSSPFVPFYAGFNLEHIFGGDSLAELFEPRKHPMKLFRKSKNEILLYQDPTPISGVESLTEFRVTAPHYIDITFNCIFHNLDFFQHSYAGLFWASYINQPDDRKIYFKGTNKNKSDFSWIEAFSIKHGVYSTHKHIEDDHNFYFADNFNATLASHFSEFRYSSPFYFGKFHNMVLAYLFESEEVIRFSQSPTGGGEFNPAWDFQYLIPNPEMEKVYAFKVRMIYKPFVSKEDIAMEYLHWNKRLDDF